MRRALPMAQYCRLMILQAVSCYREAMHWAAGRPWLRGLQSEYDDPVPVDEIEDFIMPAFKMAVTRAHECASFFSYLKLPFICFCF